MPQTQSIDDVMNLITKKLAQTAKKNFVQAEGSAGFWIYNGQVLRNLKDLNAAFETMNPEQFAYHVTKDKNDFANWVEFVLMDPILAGKLRSFKTQKTMGKTVGTYIKKYYAV